MKRTLSLLLTAALLLVTTCACGGADPVSSQSAPASQSAAASSAPVQTEPEKLDLTLAFTGDINLDDDWYVMQYLKNSAGGKLIRLHRPGAVGEDEPGRPVLHQ